MTDNCTEVEKVGRFIWKLSCDSHSKLVYFTNFLFYMKGKQLSVLALRPPSVWGNLISPPIYTINSLLTSQTN